MSENFWCVTPETDEVTIEVAGHQAKLWLKRELTVGEQREVDTAGFRSVGGLGGGRQRAGGPASEPEIMVDWKAQSFARTLAYVADWDMTDGKGNKLKIARATIESLRQSVHEAIEVAISAHIERQEALRKNVQSGESLPPAISA